MNNKNNNLISLSLVIIIISYFIIWMLLTPALTENRYQVSLTKSEVKLAQEKLDSIGSVESRITEVKDIIDKVGIALPVDSDFQSILVSLEAIATKNGVPISNFQPSSEVVAPEADISNPFPKVSFSFSVAGDYAHIVSLVKDLESNLRLIKIDSIVLSQLDAVSLQASISGSSYSRQAQGGSGE